MKKKKLLIITTGGTLACVQDDKGLLPGLSGKEILSHISHITGLYEVDFLELFQLDSANIQPAHWQEIARTIYENCTKYQGMVIFHGRRRSVHTGRNLYAERNYTVGAQLCRILPAEDKGSTGRGAEA